jgi:hypothetical protein
LAWISQIGGTTVSTEVSTNPLHRALKYLPPRLTIAYCETGGQAAVVDVYEVHEDEGHRSRKPGLKADVRMLFEGCNPGKRRTKGVNFHRARLAREAEKKKAISGNETPKSETAV